MKQPRCRRRQKNGLNRQLQILCLIPVLDWIWLLLRSLPQRASECRSANAHCSAVQSLATVRHEVLDESAPAPTTRASDRPLPTSGRHQTATCLLKQLICLRMLSAGAASGVKWSPQTASCVGLSLSSFRGPLSPLTFIIIH